ncbi:MAG: hypothetical protein ACR2MB_07275 [Acidimicrobiales bacterium]
MLSEIVDQSSASTTTAVLVEAADQYAAHDRLHSCHPRLLARQLAKEVSHAEAEGRTVALSSVSVATARSINERTSGSEASLSSTPPSRPTVPRPASVTASATHRSDPAVETTPSATATRGPSDP